jgi:hypothetical protein
MYIYIIIAVGLNLSVPRLGGACNSFLIPKIYEMNRNIAEPLLFSTFICFFGSFVGGLILITLDKKYRPYVVVDPSIVPATTPADGFVSVRSLRNIKPFENVQELYPKYGISFPEESVGSLQSLDKMPTIPKQAEEKVLLSQISKMPRIFWILLLISSLAESLFVPFLNNANKLYQTRFGFTNVGAGEILVIPYVAAFIFTPFLGIFMSMNRSSPRARYILFSSSFFLITHVMFATLPNCFECVASIFPLVGLGLCFAVFASIIMPSVPIFVGDEKVLGTAFGLAAIMQNILLTVFPLLSAYVFEAVSSSST